MPRTHNDGFYVWPSALPILINQPKPLPKVLSSHFGPAKVLPEPEAQFPIYLLHRLLIYNLPGGTTPVLGSSPLPCLHTFLAKYFIILIPTGFHLLVPSLPLFAIYTCNLYKPVARHPNHKLIRSWGHIAYLRRQRRRISLELPGKTRPSLSSQRAVFPSVLVPVPLPFTTMTTSPRLLAWTDGISESGRRVRDVE